jgi:hypothetical protein
MDKANKYLNLPEVGKLLFGRPMHRWESNIKMELKD